MSPDAPAEVHHLLSHSSDQACSTWPFARQLLAIPGFFPQIEHNVFLNKTWGRWLHIYSSCLVKGQDGSTSSTVGARRQQASWGGRVQGSRNPEVQGVRASGIPLHGAPFALCCWATLGQGFSLPCGSGASCSLRAVVYQEAPSHCWAGLRLGFVLQIRGFLQPQSSSVPGSPYATMWQVHTQLYALELLAVPQGRMQDGQKGRDGGIDGSGGN